MRSAGKSLHRAITTCNDLLFEYNLIMLIKIELAGKEEMFLFLLAVIANCTA
jgi:hypothetical protein